MRFKVIKRVEFVWESIEADSPEAALSAANDGDPTVRMLSEKARDLDRAARKPGQGAITDRELRPGRRFVARYKGKDYAAVIQDDHQIAVEGVGTFKTLSAAGMKITGHAINGWAWFRDAPAEEPPAPTRTPHKAKARKRTKQARPPTPEAEPEPAQE